MSLKNESIFDSEVNANVRVRAIYEYPYEYFVDLRCGGYNGTWKEYVRCKTLEEARGYEKLLYKILVTRTYSEVSNSPRAERRREKRNSKNQKTAAAGKN